MANRKLFIFREVKWAVICAIILSVAIALFLDNIHILGRNIPTSTIGGDYFRGFMTALILAPCVFLLPARSTEVVSLLLLWGARSLVTLGFMLYYEYTYGLDAYLYYSEAVSNVDFNFTITEFNGTNSVIAIARFIVDYIPFLASYHALKVLWSFFGFLGCFVFYKAFTRTSGKADLKVLWLLGLFPSVLFWSSILGKDPITFLGISLFFYGSLELFRKFNLVDFSLAVGGLAMMGVIRIWLVVVFVLPFLLVYIFRSQMKIFNKVLITSLSVFAIVYFANNILAATEVEDSGSLLDKINQVSRSWSRGGSGQNVQYFSSTKEAVAFLPKGIFTALFRPLPGEVNNLFGVLSGFENMLLLIGLIISFFMADPRYRSDRFIQYAFTTIFVWSIFYAYLSYQNLGTAVRFKLQVLPLLLLVPIRLLHYSKDKESS